MPSADAAAFTAAFARPITVFITFAFPPVIPLIMPKTIFLPTLEKFEASLSADDLASVITFFASSDTSPLPEAIAVPAFVSNFSPTAVPPFAASDSPAAFAPISI